MDAGINETHSRRQKTLDAKKPAYLDRGETRGPWVRIKYNYSGFLDAMGLGNSQPVKNVIEVIIAGFNNAAKNKLISTR